MPTVRKLAPEEVQTIENKGKGTRKLMEEQYDRFLSEYEIGDYGEAELEEEEKRLTVRNRLKAAASRRSIGIDFKRTQGSIIRFKIIEQGSSNGAVRAPRRAAAAKAPPPAPAKRKGGRPKKQR